MCSIAVLQWHSPLCGETPGRNKTDMMRASVAKNRNRLFMQRSPLRKRGVRLSARLVATVVLLFVSVAARAQTVGSISGTVKDTSGSVIPDIAVIARNADTNVQLNA